jgi:pimeloyl-ACP methyl ester carboxylesterase
MDFMKVLFFHGGPGFNSRPESQLLSERFASEGFHLILWNEPSTLRPSGPQFRETDAYSNLLFYAEEFFLSHYEGSPLAIMTHSFGANSACYLAKKHPEKIAEIFFVAPGLALPVIDQNIFRFTALDYIARGDERGRDLQKITDQLSETFDQNTEAAFGLVAQNPYYFDYYWHNQEAKKIYASHFADPGFQFDILSFLAVRRSYIDIDLKNSRVPAVAIHGKHDIVVSSAIETSMLQRKFASLKSFELAHSSHYPHVEQPDEVLAIIKQELSSLKKQPVQIDTSL